MKTQRGKITKYIGMMVLLMVIVLQAEAVQAGAKELSDGNYKIDVTLSGGSGRAFIASPAEMTVKENQAWVSIEWSSPNYDYMKLGEEIYYPVNQDGNSVFLLPVTAFNEEVTVIADTVAMSTPHEITYTLIFDLASVQGENSVNVTAILIGIILLAGIVLCVFIGKKKKS